MARLGLYHDFSCGLRRCGELPLIHALCLCALSRSIIEVAAPLVEKVTVDVRASRAASVMVTVTCWTVVTIVITTSYKSRMKSNYLIEPKYDTKWKYFREIENFTFIHAESSYDEVWLGMVMVTQGFRKWNERLNVCMTEGNSYDQKCVQSHEPLFWQMFCIGFESTDIRFACGIFHLALHAAYFCALQYCPEDAKFKEWLQQRNSLLHNMASHSRVRPFSRLRNVIWEEMLQARAAFVSPAESFDADWKIFEEESKALRVRFVHSEHAEDFGSMFGYQLTSGFNEHLRNTMGQRAEMLME